MLLNKSIIISVDAMGGANAPFCVVEGISLFVNKTKALNYFFKIFGDQVRVKPLLEKYPELAGRYELIHCPTFIADDEQPVKALKQGKESSMRKAIDAIKEEKSPACISSGNTGALMVIAKMVLGSLRDIKRPAIISVFPNFKEGVVVLDLGANTDCDEHNFLQFALMGHCYARIMLQKNSPSIGILNVGTEHTKGREVEKKAYELLKNSSLNFYGHIEGNDLTQGTVDVVVTDGFSGNVMIKVAEGTARICRDLIKQAFNENLLSKLGGLLAKRSLKSAFSRLDPRKYNGAMLIGINGIVVKSHGSSDSFAFANAIEVTYNLVKQNINSDISKLIEQSSKRETIVDKIIQKLGF